VAEAVTVGALPDQIFEKNVGRLALFRLTVI